MGHGVQGLWDPDSAWVSIFSELILRHLGLAGKLGIIQLCWPMTQRSKRRPIQGHFLVFRPLDAQSPAVAAG